MTTKRELPDGTTISHDGTTRHWTLNDGTVLRSDAFGPWVPCIEFPAQTCEVCGLEHPGEDCQQDDLFTHPAPDCERCHDTGIDWNGQGCAKCGGEL